MADAKKKAYPKFTSPRLTLVYPKLSDVDYGSKEYPKPEGEYSTKAKGSASDPQIKAFIAKLQPLYDEALATAEEEFKKLKVETRKKLGSVKMNDLFTTLYDQETEEPTGEIEFKFAMAAGGVIKNGPKAGKVWTSRPDLFDARGMPIKGTPVLNKDGTHSKDRAGKLVYKMPDIWGGTVARISFEASPYFIPGTGAGGLKLRLSAAQIIDLVAGGSRTASSHGFEAEEDGYAYAADEGSDDVVEEASESFEGAAQDEGSSDF